MESININNDKKYYGSGGMQSVMCVMGDMGCKGYMMSWGHEKSRDARDGLIGLMT